MSKQIPDLDIVTQLQAEDQFIFWQNSSRKAKRVSRNNMLGSPGIIVKGKVIDPEYGDLGLSAATATNNAATALSTANGAQTSANGKNKIFYQTTAPTNPISGYSLVVNDLWFDTDGGYQMYKWSGSAWSSYQLDDAALAHLDVGKLTAGFIGAQVIAINGSDGGGTSGTNGTGGYIESTSFVPTWVSGSMTVRQYTTSGTYGNYLGKYTPSDVVQVKVLQTDGSYRLFRSNTNQGTNATSAPPASGNNTDWTEITGASIPTFTVPISSTENATVQNFGFRIASNGYGEFAGGLFRGAVIANEGFFGNTKNAARIDSNGLTIGDNGRIKSAGIGYSGSNFTGGSGFFLGNTQAEASTPAYQFFVGDTGGNYIRWDGASTLYVLGNIIGGSTVGSSGSVGLRIQTQYGIRRSVSDNILTITGGDGNGIYYGAQIDYVGSGFATSGTSGIGDGSGQLILSAGYRLSSNYDSPLDGAIIFRTSRENNPVDSGNDNHSGIQRFRIEADGTVRVVWIADGIADGEAMSGYPNSGRGNFIVDGSTADNQISIKNGVLKFYTDTNLYRYAADALGTDDDLYIGGNATRYIYFPNGGNIVWSADTNLYRSAANTLKTDDNFIAASVTTTSARRSKKNIKKYKSGLEIVSKLNPVSFTRKMDNKNDIGFIAEDVDKILSTIVAKNDKGQVEGLDYSKITVVLVNAIKELKKEIDDLKGE